MGVPPAELEITEPLVRGLLRDQHPALADRPLRLAASGWDNEMWRLGDDLAVRLPRRAFGVELLETERRWLPELAPGLPVPVPVPLHLGAPGDGYPWPWCIVPWFRGTTVDRHGRLTTAGAATLGAAMRALHREADPAAPANPHRGIPLRERGRTPAEILGRRDRRLNASLDALWERALAAPDAPVRTWIHGDLHVRNILSWQGELSAVIDWGDLCAGDPAVDLSARYTVLDGRTVAAFDAAYGGVDAVLDDRSRGWAALFCAIVMDAYADEDPEWVGWAERALLRLVHDERRRGSAPAPGT